MIDTMICNILPNICLNSLNMFTYYGCSVRFCMTINVHWFWLLILKAHHVRVQKNLHSLFGLWSKIHNGGPKVLTKQFFRNRSSDPSFESKFYADQEFQWKHGVKNKCLKDMMSTWDVLFSRFLLCGVNSMSLIHEQPDKISVYSWKYIYVPFYL